MDAELEAVKRELRNLKGCTILTVPKGKPRKILAIDDEWLLVAAEPSPEGVLIRWSSVLRVYEDLRKDGSVPSGKYAQGAFIMPFLAALTTVEITSRPQRTCYYVRRGRPARLRISCQ